MNSNIDYLRFFWGLFWGMMLARMTAAGFFFWPRADSAFFCAQILRLFVRSFCVFLCADSASFCAQVLHHLYVLLHFNVRLKIIYPSLDAVKHCSNCNASFKQPSLK